MKNITIAIDDEVYRAARVHAAERGTSVSALVKDYFTGLVAGEATRPANGVREMPVPFVSGGLAGSPPVGKAVWTRDGKPRQPGALRASSPIGDGLDSWPEGMLASLDDWDEGDFDPLA